MLLRQSSLSLSLFFDDESSSFTFCLVGKYNLLFFLRFVLLFPHPIILFKILQTIQEKQVLLIQERNLWKCPEIGNVKEKEG